MDCVNCLIGFANNKSSHRISLKAIALLRICEDRLAEVFCFSPSLDCNLSFNLLVNSFSSQPYIPTKPFFPKVNGVCYLSPFSHFRVLNTTFKLSCTEYISPFKITQMNPLVILLNN